MPTRWSSSASLGIADPLAGDSIRKKEPQCAKLRAIVHARRRGGDGDLRPVLGSADRTGTLEIPGKELDIAVTASRPRIRPGPSAPGCPVVEGASVGDKASTTVSNCAGDGPSPPQPPQQEITFIKRVPTGESRVHSNGCGTRAGRPRMIGQQEINEPLSGSRMMGGSRPLG